MVGAALALVAVYLVRAGSSPRPEPVAADVVSPVSSSAPRACARDRVLVTAHRGTGPGTRLVSGREYAENTLPAFHSALDAGADGVEADWWPTSDGQVVAHHDPTLERMTGSRGRIDQHTWAEVAAARVRGGARMARFGEVVAAVRGRGAHRQQELKDASVFSTRALEQMVRTDLDGDPDAYGRVLYTSSRMSTLRRLHTLDVRLSLGLITRSATGRPVLARLPSWLDVVHIDLRAADRAYVRAAVEHGFAVSVRGVDTVAQLQRAADLGATRVLTNRAEVLGRAC